MTNQTTLSSPKNRTNLSENSSPTYQNGFSSQVINPYIPSNPFIYPKELCDPLKD